MAKTKRFNSNYRKYLKSGSRKNSKKGKRRLNKSKSTKRRYKKVKI